MDEFFALLKCKAEEIKLMCRGSGKNQITTAVQIDRLLHGSTGDKILINTELAKKIGTVYLDIYIHLERTN